MFKVGDKVKLISFPIEKYVGQIHELVSIHPTSSTFAGRLKLRGYGNVLVYKREIEKAIPKNQQLLFSFMDER